MTIWKRDARVELNYTDSDEGGAGNNAGISYGGDHDTVIRKTKDGKDIVWEQYDGYEVCRVQDNGGFTHTKRVVAVTAALDMSDVSTAMKYSGALFTIDADGGAYAITLPTATSTAEGSTIVGWHGTFMLTDVHATNDVTIVRGDTSNDALTSAGIHVVDGNSGDGLTISSDVVTFDASGADAVGDHVQIWCTSASATATAFYAKAFIAS